jgi:hypothetical protein
MFGVNLDEVPSLMAELAISENEFPSTEGLPGRSPLGELISVALDAHATGGSFQTMSKGKLLKKLMKLKKSISGLYKNQRMLRDEHSLPRKVAYISVLTSAPKKDWSKMTKEEIDTSVETISSGISHIPDRLKTAIAYLVD